VAELERKIAIIGASGMLGHALSGVFQHAILLDFKPSDSSIRYVDITQLDKLEEAFADFGSNDWVINAAAYTKVDLAETEAGGLQSFRVNVNGPENLAKVSRSTGSKIIHFSTAYVFDGKAGLYIESDERYPLNTYGKHKLVGENPVLDVGGVVLRTDTLYGPHGENFVDDIVIANARRRLAKGIKTIEIVRIK